MGHLESICPAKPTVQVDEWLVAAEITPEGAINIESGLNVSVEMAMDGSERVWYNTQGPVMMLSIAESPTGYSWVCWVTSTGCLPHMRLAHPVVGAVRHSLPANQTAGSSYRHSFLTQRFPMQYMADAISITQMRLTCHVIPEHWFEDRFLEQYFGFLKKN